MFRHLFSCSLAVVSITAPLSAQEQSLRPIVRSLALTPEVLAAAGYQASDLVDIAARLRGAEQEVALLREAEQVLANAVRAESTACTAAVERPDSEERKLALITAREAKATASLALAARARELRAIALGPNDSRRDIAERILSAPRTVPVSFRACRELPSSWSDVQVALTAEARSLRSDANSVSESARSLLAAIRTDSGVIAAQQHLDANCASLQAAWPHI